MRSRLIQALRCSARTAITALATVWLVSCDRFPLQSTARTEDLARQAQQAGDYPKAIRLYEELLDGTEKTADYHYRLGLLYDDKLSDPVSALHHFRRYLKMAGEGAKRAQVKEYIKRIELIVATKAADSGLMTKNEAARLKNENAELRRQLGQLREQLKAATTAAKPAGKAERDAKGFSTNPVTRKAEKAIGPETRTYTVQKGDTLASISRKFYKTPQRWKDIEDANYNALGGSVDLKVGQILIIPQ